MTQTVIPAQSTEFVVRVVADDELRTANVLFREAVHAKPLDDEKWATVAKIYEPGRTFGAFAGTTMAGTAMSISSSLTVPGGANVSMAAVTAVAVRADHRRRGALTGLMRAQLNEVAAAGEVLATLHSSEPVIYGRFGYGVGTVGRTIRIRSGRARLRDDVPTAGTVRFLSIDEALRVLPEAYSRILPTRAGLMGRSPAWWALGYESREKDDYLRIAVHAGPDGSVDGFVAYRPGTFASDDPRAGSELTVLDFQAADQSVTNDLWRFLLGIDLVEQLVVVLRPLDDPIEAMLENFYVVRSEPDDELWVRVVDVPAALAARTYGIAEPVVIDIVDPLLANNSGRYLVSPQGMERTDAPAALRFDVDVLGMIYLGAWRPSTLAAIGRIDARDPMALAAADRLFAADRPSWCGTLF